MKKNTAGISFLIFCLILAFLLLTHTITSIQSGALFALALIIFGGISKGFTKNKDHADK